MRATQAYIASAGTAAVMLAAALSLFAMVSGLVAFGAWPASETPTSVDEMLVTSIERPEKQAVRVRRDAPVQPRSTGRGTNGGSGNTRSAGGAPTHATTGSGTTVATAPIAPTPATTQGGSQGGGLTDTTNPASPVTRTTQPLLQNAPQPVQDVANQVNQVIDQAGSAVPPPQKIVEDTVGGVVGP